MFAVERYEAIIAMLNEKGNVTISELAQTFNVSTETVRKDLMFLEKEKKLVRTHGGAVCTLKRKMFRPLKERVKSFAAEKRELSQYACEFLENDDTIAIDEGSTAIEFAKVILNKNLRLRVVTHSMDVFNILSQNNRIEIILCGGEYVKEENAFAGVMTMEMAKSVYTNKAFIFPSAISLEFGMSMYQSEYKFLEIEKVYVKNTDKVFILADSKKFEKKAFVKSFDISKKYTYVTDSALDGKICDLYKKAGLNVVKGRVEGGK